MQFSHLCYLCSDDSDKNALSILPSFSTKSVKSLRVLVLFFNLQLVKEIHLDWHTENNLIVCPLHALECKSGEELIDTVASKHSDIKKRA